MNKLSCCSISVKPIENKTKSNLSSVLIGKDTLLNMTGLTERHIFLSLKSLEKDGLIKYKKIKNIHTNKIDSFVIRFDNRMALHHFCNLNQTPDNILEL